MHAHEVAELLRHVEGMKEAVRQVREEVAARLPEPAVFDHVLRCLIGAALGGCEPEKEFELAHRIQRVEYAAHLAAVSHGPVAPIHQHPRSVAGGGA